MAEPCRSKHCCNKYRTPRKMQMLSLRRLRLWQRLHGMMMRCAAPEMV